MRKIFGILVVGLMVVFGSLGVSAAPMLTKGEGGGSTPVVCMTTSMATAPTSGVVLVGANGNYSIVVDGKIIGKVAEEGRLASGHGPALISDQVISAPACGSTTESDNVRFVNGACFALKEGAEPHNIPCAMP